MAKSPIFKDVHFNIGKRQPSYKNACCCTKVIKNNVYTKHETKI